MTKRDTIKSFIPPIVLQLIRDRRSKSYRRIDNPEWEYIPEGWSYARKHPEVKGWNVRAILETYKRKWPRFVEIVQGTGPLGVAHESELTANIDLCSHNTIMSFAYALTQAALYRTSLSMLDWGGGIGHYYLLAQALLPTMEIEYHCMDVPLLANYGAELFPDQHFYSDDSCFQRSYDFVLASASMHYAEDWKSLLTRLREVTQGYLYVTRLPIVRNAPSYVFLQRACCYGYDTEYLGWCLNRREFLEAAQGSGLVLVREFIIGENPNIVNAPEACQYHGFLFNTPEAKGKSLS